MKKTSSTRTLEETLSQSSLLSGGSTNFSDDTLSDKLSEPTPVQSAAIRSRNRFSAALRKFRSTKKNRVSSKKYSTTTGIMRSDDEQDSSHSTAAAEIEPTPLLLREQEPEQSPKPVKRKNKAANLVKKISFGSLKKVTKKSEIGNNLSSSRPSSMSSGQQQEKFTLKQSLSETSLIDLDSDNDNNNGNQQSKSKTHQMQIKISGKKIMKSDDDTMKNINLQNNNEIDQLLRPSNTPEPNKPERRIKKLNITESSIDIAPTNVAPATPVSNKKGILLTGGGVLSASGGAIKKTTTPKTVRTSTDPTLSESIFMNKTVSLERGRRFPRPIDDYRTVSDLNAISSVIDKNIVSDRPSIEFEVGKQVRPITSPSTSSLSSSKTLNNTNGVGDTGIGLLSSSILIDSLESTISNLPSRDEFSSMDTTKSSESSSEPKSESSSRRRITYVAVQPDISMPSEMSLLDAHEPISHLSGISEYSIDSDFSMCPSSYYGDFMTDEDRVGFLLIFFIHFMRVFVVIYVLTLIYICI